MQINSVLLIHCGDLRLTVEREEDEGALAGVGLILPLKVVLNFDTPAQSLIPYLFHKRVTSQLFPEGDARYKQ